MISATGAFEANGVPGLTDSRPRAAQLPAVVVVAVPRSCLLLRVSVTLTWPLVVLGDRQTTAFGDAALASSRFALCAEGAAEYAPETVFKMYESADEGRPLTEKE